MAPPTCSYLLIRNKRHSIRLRVPVDLVPTLGRTELVRALGTSHRRSAAFIVAGVALHLDQLWSMIGKGKALTPDVLQRLADDWLRAAIADQWIILERGDFAAVMAPADLDDAGRRAFSAEMYGRDAMGIIELVLEEVKRKDARRFDTEAGRVLKKAGFGERRGTQERAILSRLMLEAFVDLQETKVAWADGDVAAMPPQLAQPLLPSQRGEAAAHPATGSAAQPVAASRSIKAAIDLFIARKRQNKATEKQIIDVQSDLRLLSEAFGEERQVATVTTADAGGLFEALQSLPAHFRVHPELQGLTVLEKAATARELELPPLEFRTVKSYLGAWRNLFEQELQAGQVSSNPFADKTVTKPRKFVEQDRTFRPDELEMLFGCPLFQGSKSNTKRYDPGPHLVDDWMFWAPLIALFTGARIGEIAQLRPNDVRVVEGVAVLDINEDDGKTLKNHGTARPIPVHSRLEEIGLLRLAARQKAMKARLLLPAMPGKVHGDAGKQPGAWMSERLLKRLDLKSRKGLGFHSLRHTLKTALRNAHVPDSISNELCGHDEGRSGGVGAKYGRVEVKAMKEGLERIELPDAVGLIKPRYLPIADGEAASLS